MKQYGVLPYVRRGGKAELVLITSRTSQRWIFPKGARVAGKSRRGSALQEAFEEAGLIGRIDPRFEFREIIVRNGRKIELTIFALRVEKLLKSWPEQKQRDRIVVPADKARKMVNCPQLRRCVKQWRRAS